MERFPQEYQSFIATVAKAETLAERGESLQSENVYRLALLKGHLLAKRVAEPEPPRVSPDPASPPDSQSDSHAGSSPPGSSEPIPMHVQVKEPTMGSSVPLLSESASLTSKTITVSVEADTSPEPIPLTPHSTLLQSVPEQPLQTLLQGEELPLADMKRFIGNRGYYTVKRGDSIKRVGARLGVEWRQLARNNGLDSSAPLTPGQVIVYDNRKIVPSALRDGIVINIADRTLYLLKNGAVERSYPVAVGKPPKPDDDEDWSTPTGRFIITTKTKDPVWRVPQSIQDEMEQRGREPIKEMPAGKGNPLGKYAMKTSLSGIVIHSTNAPSSIYTYASHGCVRVMPEHMEKLFPAVEPRTSGMIVYQPVKLALSPEGRVFLEVNGDVYGRFLGNLELEVRKLVSRRKVESKVDWNKVARLLKKKSGIPEDITRDLDETSRPKAAVRQKTVSVIPR
jgi:L,D-transpeptidase ErfK/SrfK